MIYISAQPDSTYFIWQLEIQLLNFFSLNIDKEHIHVLVAFNPEVGLRSNFKDFIHSNSHLAQFFVYEDLRKSPKYTSSIRPNILRQHFEKFPDLESHSIFYHDSDILFSRIPEIPDIPENMTCYVSDTRNYIDSDYIKKAGSNLLLKQMAAIVGVKYEVIENNKDNSGGAQYVLKGINADFWQKVEKDCESLFITMQDFNKKKWEIELAENGTYKSEKKGIQAWCADMWAVLWNLWFLNKKVEIHSELDFSWPFSPINEWTTKPILHYSGNIRDNKIHFKKTDYINFEPWYDDSIFSIPKSNCSFKILEWIKIGKESRDSKRPTFRETCIIYNGRSWAQKDSSLFMIIKQYVQKFIDIEVFLFQDSNETVPMEKNSNFITYKNFILFTNPLIIDIHIILDILNKQFAKETTIIPEEIYKIDSLFTETFSKVLDIELFHYNKGKFNKTLQEWPSYTFHYYIGAGTTDEKYEKISTILINEDFCYGNTATIPMLYSF